LRKSAAEVIPCATHVNRELCARGPALGEPVFRGKFSRACRVRSEAASDAFAALQILRGAHMLRARSQLGLRIFAASRNFIEHYFGRR
jgi:hypothetical protein